MKILIVDDSITMRKIIRKSLATAGYEDVVETGDGAEALEYMEGVDLVLTDWNMPVMDGLTLVRELRQNPEYENIPIIMVTTEGSESEVIKALKQGVNDYVVKPFTPDVIQKKVEELSL